MVAAGGEVKAVKCFRRLATTSSDDVLVHEGALGVARATVVMMV